MSPSHGITFAIITQDKITSELPHGPRTSICIISNNLIKAEGAGGAFDQLYFCGARVRRAETAVIVSSEAHVLPYATAAALAVGLGSNVILVETLPTRELEWTAFIERYRPGIIRMMTTVKPEGRPQCWTPGRRRESTSHDARHGLGCMLRLPRCMRRSWTTWALNYALKRMVTYVCVATSTFNELIAAKACSSGTCEGRRRPAVSDPSTTGYGVDDIYRIWRRWRTRPGLARPGCGREGEAGRHHGERVRLAQP